MLKWANWCFLNVPNCTLIDQKLKFWPIFEANFGQKAKFSQFFVKLERILVRIGQISPFGQNWLQKIGQKFNFWSIKVQLGTFRKHQFAHFSMSEALGIANLWFFGQIVVRISFFWPAKIVQNPILDQFISVE